MGSTQRSLVSQAFQAAKLAWQAGGLLTGSAVGATLVTGLAPIITAWYTRSLIDQLGRPTADAARLYATVAVLGLAGLLLVAMPPLTVYIEAEARRRLTLLVEDRLFSAVNSFEGLAQFEQPEFHDELRLAQQAGTAAPQQLLSGGLGLVQAAVTLTGFVVALAVIDARLAVLAVASAVPGLLAEVRLTRIRADLSWDLSPAERRRFFYRDLQTNPHAAKEIRLFGLDRFFRGRMVAEIRRINAGERRLDRRTLMAHAGLACLGAILALCGSLFAVDQAIHGALSVGDVAVVLVGLVAVGGATTTIVTHTSELYRCLILFGHYDGVVTAASRARKQEASAVPGELRSAIELHDIWFRYSDDHPWVLSGVNLRIQAGTSLALVGANGAGKSTLIQLLCRFYDPTRGSILWDGVDIRRFSAREMRRRLGAVFQDFMCYDLAAAENIGIGALAGLDDRGQVRRAASRAGIADRLDDLPVGYDTMLTRMFADSHTADAASAGVILSGGEWQRVAVARAMMRQDCDVLFLDEPSAGLDAQAEGDLHERLTALRQDRTSILISHRLNTVRNADLIVVLESGRIIEQGSHAELMSAGGVYATMFERQAAGYRESPVDVKPSDDFVVPSR